jgi:hypothetical protein
MVEGTDREVLVTEVTRMTGGMVCVAGLDLATGRMVRPLQPDGRNWEEEKWIGGGWLRVGQVVRLRSAAQAGPAALPHAHEDFRVAHVASVRTAPAAELYDACRRTADSTLEAIVGDTLIEGKYVEEGTDCRSLGCLLMEGSALRFSGRFDKIQVSWRDDAATWHNLKLTDLAASRLADTEAEATRLGAAAAFAAGPVALRLGLTRPWAGQDGQWKPRRCTLQLNGLVFPA